MVSRLLKSCATPPVSWPTASIFCDCRSASSAMARSSTASATRLSRVAFNSRSSASRACSSSSRARASYCRRRPLSAVRATLIRVVEWNGRSTKRTLPRMRDSRAAFGLRSAPPWRVSRMNGMSDHAGCAPTQRLSKVRSAVRTASSVTSTAPATSSRLRTSPDRSGTTTAARSAPVSSARASAASRPCGAKISTRSEFGSFERVTGLRCRAAPRPGPASARHAARPGTSAAAHRPAGRCR